MIECGGRFWTKNGWARCIMERGHAGKCRDGADTSQEQTQGGADDLHRLVRILGDTLRGGHYGF